MKNLTIPLSIIIGSLIISIAVYFSITNEKRMQFNICMKSLFYSNAKGQEKRNDYNELKERSKEVCKTQVYRR